MSIGNPSYIRVGVGHSVTRCWNKKEPNLKSKSSPKSSHVSFLKISPPPKKEVFILGYFCTVICHQELTKIAPLWSYWWGLKNLKSQLTNK